MQAECERLETARQDVKRLGMTEHTHDALFRAAHDIKGEAATFGYPEVAGVADSLCRLLEHTPEIGAHPDRALVDQHVDAVRAITREYARPDLAEVAGALTLRLREVTDDFLKRENDFRPDYLESIFSPPLAPGSARNLTRLTPRAERPIARRNRRRRVRRRTAALLRAPLPSRSGATA